MANEPGLALYLYDGCPYCERVRRAVSRLGIQLEERNIHEHRKWNDELRAARGRSTVPVLRIEDDGPVRWMPESADIVVWLERRYGVQA